MKKKTAIAVGALLSITMISCACSERRAGSSVYSANLAESLPEDADSKPDLSIESNPTPAASAPETSEPAKPLFDDPDTYIQINPENGTYILPEDEKKLTEESLFVGDSICSGFWACGMIRSQSVYAAGAVGARNLLEYKMYYRNQPAKFAPVLQKAQPKNVLLWMGMNDVNMSTAEEFCENYRAIIDTALENSEAEIYVCAISPILNLEFTKLEYINEFNDAISAFIEENYAERVRFIDFTAPFKTDEGLLDEQYNGGDGIHLTTRAYYIAIHEINKTIKNK
ncbi:MAG: SGNH/GDSL hydrolase family protein [Oscillospiraceae bacterium]|nr:SGNH/GDSL hydrolase family protein [Oscillospiraceae bacterium]